MFPVKDEKKILLLKKFVIGFSCFMIVWNIFLFVKNIYGLATKDNPLLRIVLIHALVFNIFDAIMFTLCIVGMLKNNIRLLVHPLSYTYWSFIWQLFLGIGSIAGTIYLGKPVGIISVILCVFYLVFYYSLFTVYKNIEVSTKFVEWIDEYADEHGKKVVVIDA
jgi:hypothetical protein